MRNTTTSQINLPCTLPLGHNCHISRDKMSSENWNKWDQDQSYAVLQPGRSFAYIPLWLTQFPWRKFPSRALSNGCLAQEPSSHNTALQIAHSIHCVPPWRRLNIPFLVTHGFCPDVSHAFFSVSSANPSTYGSKSMYVCKSECTNEWTKKEKMVVVPAFLDQNTK